MKKVLLIFFILLSFSSTKPAFAALDYSGLVQCDGVVTPGEENRKVPCNFASFVSMANYVVRWLFSISVLVMIGIIAYAGFLYMSPPSSGKRQDANKMLWAALKGFVIMLVAWFIVSTLLKWLVNPEFKGAGTLLEQQK